MYATSVEGGGRSRGPSRLPNGLGTLSLGARHKKLSVALVVGKAKQRSPAARGFALRAPGPLTAAVRQR